MLFIVEHKSLKNLSAWNKSLVSVWIGVEGGCSEKNFVSASRVVLPNKSEGRPTVLGFRIKVDNYWLTYDKTTCVEWLLPSGIIIGPCEFSSCEGTSRLWWLINNSTKMIFTIPDEVQARVNVEWRGSQKGAEQQKIHFWIFLFVSGRLTCWDKFWQCGGMGGKCNESDWRWSWSAGRVTKPRPRYLASR